MEPKVFEKLFVLVYSLIDRLPKGKQVELIMVSGGGGTRSSSEGTKNLVIDRECEVVGYTNVAVKVNRKTGKLETKALDKELNLSYLFPIATVIGGALLIAGAYGLGRMSKK